MEWMNRAARPNQQASHAGAPHDAGHGKKGGASKGSRIVSVAMLFSVTIILLALIAYAVLGGPAKENKYVDGGKFQAVFLNGGQVYFGKIGSLNDKYLRMSNIYYLRVNQQVQPNQQTSSTETASNDISLVKLGCELHGPTDEMLINRDQVVFWENLKDDGQVAKAVAEYVKQNPNGQNCTTAANNNSSTTPATTPATTPTTKK